MKKVILLSAVSVISFSVNTQNVGIGTSTPAGKLEIRHLSGVGSPTLLLYDNSPANYARIQLQNASGNKYWHVAGFIDDLADANSRLNFFHSNYGDVMGITGDGKVGIGTNNPSEKLSVVTSLGYGISHISGSKKIATYIDNSGVWMGSVSDDPLHFYTNNGASQLSLIQNGRTGIGTLSPEEKLHIIGNTKSDNFYYNNPITSYYSVSGADFRAMDGSERTFAQNSVAGVYVVNGTSGVVAPVHLPHGAVVTAFIVYLYDNSASNISVSLFMGDHLTVANTMATVTSSGVPGNTIYVDNTISDAAIDNTSKCYYIYGNITAGTWVDFNLRISRVQINYTVSKTD